MFTNKEKSPGTGIFTGESTDILRSNQSFQTPFQEYMTHKTTDKYSDEYICNNLQQIIGK